MGTNSHITASPPFRVGATSFVYPGDWRFNVERLRGRVSDIELLFFEAEGLPSKDEFEHLADLARGKHSYTVHTPLSASLASEDEKRRRAGIEEVVAVVKATALLDPHGWILHVYRGDFEGDEPPADIATWRERAQHSLSEIVERTGETKRLCVESLDYDYELIAPVIESLDLGVAWDIGHDLRDGRTNTLMLERLFPRLRVIQWHGTDPDDRDHRSLSFVPQSEAVRFVADLYEHNFRGVLTLEVFREGDFEESLALVDELLQRQEQPHATP